MLSNIDKELRFQILRNEWTYDPMFQKSMDVAWHHGMNLPGYIERIRNDSNSIHRPDEKRKNYSGKTTTRS